MDSWPTPDLQGSHNYDECNILGQLFVMNMIMRFEIPVNVNVVF